MKSLKKVSKHLGNIVSETNIAGRRYILNNNLHSGLWTGTRRYAH